MQTHQENIMNLLTFRKYGLIWPWGITLPQTEICCLEETTLASPTLIQFISPASGTN